MRLTDETLLVPSGLKLTPKQAASLGLLHGGHAWAQWISSTRGPGGEQLSDPHAADGTFDPAPQGPHLVVSPMHPDRWPAAFIVEVRMNQHKCAMRTLLAKFRQLDLNIKIITSSVGGFGLNLVQAIVEYGPFTRHVEERLHALDEAVRSRWNRACDEGAGDAACAEIIEEINELRRDEMRYLGRHHLALSVFVGTELRIWDTVLHGDQLPDETKDEYTTRMAERNSALSRVGGLSNRDLEAGVEYVPFLHTNTRHLGLNPWYLGRSRIDVAQINEAAQRLGLGDGGGADATGPIETQHRRYYSTVMRDRRLASQAALSMTYDAVPGLRYEVEQLRHVREYFGENGPEDADDRLLIELWRSQGVQPIEIKPLISLAYCRLWSHPAAPAPGVELRYDAISRTLQPLEPRDDEDDDVLSIIGGEDTQHQEDRRRHVAPGILRDQLAELSGTPRSAIDEPSVAMAFFHPSERFLRLRFLQGWFAREATMQIDIRYQHRSEADAAETPAGILENVMKALVRHGSGWQIHRVENSLALETLDQEMGRIRIIASPTGQTRRTPDAADRRTVRDGLADAIRERLLESEAHNLGERLEVEVLSLSDGVYRRPSAT